MSNELEQTHFVAGKVFVFQVPKLESSEGFKSAPAPTPSPPQSLYHLPSLSPSTPLCLSFVS